MLIDYYNFPILCEKTAFDVISITYEVINCLFYLGTSHITSFAVKSIFQWVKHAIHTIVPKSHLYHAMMSIPLNSMATL